VHAHVYGVGFDQSSACDECVQLLSFSAESRLVIGIPYVRVGRPVNVADKTGIPYSPVGRVLTRHLRKSEQMPTYREVGNAERVWSYCESHSQTVSFMLASASFLRHRRDHAH
jgi:hypothetical protein